MRGEWQFIQTSEENNQDTLKIDIYLHFKIGNVSAFSRVDVLFLGFQLKNDYRLF